MKKLCFVTTVSVTLKSFVVELAEYLHDKSGYDISFICNPDPAFRKTLPEYIHFYPVPMKRGISIRGISAILKMQWIFRREKFDLVQYSTPNASLYASVAATLSNIPIRKYHLMGFRYLGFSGFKKTLFKLIEKISCALSTDIECVSFSNLTLGVRERIFPASKAHVVLRGSSAGVDLDAFNISKKSEWRAIKRAELGYDDSNCVFGFVGRITGDKGINELLSAFASLLDTNCKLFIAGVIEDKTSLNTAVLEAAYSDDRITFYPYVNDIMQYYAMMDVLVLPSYREGFGNVVIEAEAMGIPVIVSDIPGPTDAMIDGVTGLKVPAKDSKMLRAAMQKLSADPTLRHEMGFRGKKFVEEFFDREKVFFALLDDRRKLLGD